MRLMLPVLLLVTACSSAHSDIRVQTRKYANIDIVERQVYQWSDAKAVVLDSTGTWGETGIDLDAVLREAVDRELQAAGMQRVGGGASISVQLAAVGTRADADAARARSGAATDAVVVTEGSLMVELYDVPTGAMVWRGVARSTATQEFPPEVRRQRIEYAVHEMFAQLQR